MVVVTRAVFAVIVAVGSALLIRMVGGDAPPLREGGWRTLSGPSYR